ncbi:hypothetical protein JCM3765_006576 [Sporobolomyces pararoseus]
MARTKQTARKSYGHQPVPRKKLGSVGTFTTSQSTTVPLLLSSSGDEAVGVPTKGKKLKKDEPRVSGTKGKEASSNSEKIAELKKKRKEIDKEIAKLEELEEMKRKVAKLEGQVAKMGEKK